MKPVHILAASAAALLLVGCGSREPERIPANKKEIMDRFVAGTLPASYAPAGFFCHFPSDCKEGEAAVQAHLYYFLQAGQDVLKVQFEQSVPRIPELSVREDWIPEDFYRPTLEVVTRLQQVAGADVYVIPTIYSAFQVAHQSLGEKRIIEAVKEQPEELKSLFRCYNRALVWLVKECKAAGIEGFFTPTQGGEAKFADIPGFFENFIRPFDLEVMGECNKGTKMNILHICDYEGSYDDLTRFKDYPGQIVNTPREVKGEPFTAKDAYALFGRPVLGGFDRKGDIHKVSPAQAAEMARQALLEGPAGHMMLGADCTVPYSLVPNIHAAVATAHRHE